VLLGAGTVSKQQMEEKVDAVYAEFDRHRKEYAAREADAIEADELKQLEAEIKGRKKE
jgi:hypothetical protein